MSHTVGQQETSWDVFPLPTYYCYIPCLSCPRTLGHQGTSWECLCYPIYCWTIGNFLGCPPPCFSCPRTIGQQGDSLSCPILLDFPHSYQLSHDNRTTGDLLGLSGYPILRNLLGCPGTPGTVPSMVTPHCPRSDKSQDTGTVLVHPGTVPSMVAPGLTSPRTWDCPGTSWDGPINGSPTLSQV